MVLDTLLDNQSLNSWQIYEEKMVRLWSGYVLLLAIARALWLVPLTLQMRKTSSPVNEIHRRKSGETTNVRNNITNVGSPEAKHLMLLTILFQRIFRNSALDPLVSSFTPASPQLSLSDPAPADSEDMALTTNHTPDVSYPDIEFASLDSVTLSLCSQVSDPDDSVNERGSLRPHWDAAVVTDDRHSIHSTASVYVDGVTVTVSKVGLGNGKPGCQNYSCMYGGGLSRDNIDYIYKCLKCEGPHTSSLCAKCMLNGGCCEPGHENWELIT